ncbi:hypothetical protein DFH08DRAFT_1085365 [Mycena albidolilacea]|uniref:Uncharacterized protein n=1 Tax=Mycena albidolilacea TaxID=1033008 RepID=A0AAD6ZIY6_9AGAR|nr:hypothetical protein DFH08DRAFT_1085365 [Mycena albidolilacea]
MLTTDAARSAPLPPRRSALSAPLSLPRLAASSRFTLALAPPPAHRAISMSHGRNNPALSTSRRAFPTCPQPNAAPLNVSSLSSLPALLVHELSERCATAARCVSTRRSRDHGLPPIHSLNPFASSCCASVLFPPLPPSTYAPVTCCRRTSIASSIRRPSSFFLELPEAHLRTLPVVSALVLSLEPVEVQTEPELFAIPEGSKTFIPQSSLPPLESQILSAVQFGFDRPTSFLPFPESQTLKSIQIWSAHPTSRAGLPNVDITLRAPGNFNFGDGVEEKGGP